MSDLLRVELGGLHPEIQEAIRQLKVAFIKHRPDYSSIQLSIDDLVGEQLTSVDAITNPNLKFWDIVEGGDDNG